MTAVREWQVDIALSEDEWETYAEARLPTRNLSGHGRARRNPSDANVPEIGEELAASRALSDLAHRLLSAAAEDIQTHTHQPAHLRR